jgi:hypothetical protein
VPKVPAASYLELPDVCARSESFCRSVRSSSKRVVTSRITAN